MAGLQTVIDNATSIIFGRTKVASQTVSRSGRILTAEVVSGIPFQFEVSTSEGLTYSGNRSLLEEIDRLDISETSTIDFGSTNTGLAYLTEYQGDISSAELGDITLNGFGTDEIYMNTLSVTGSGTLFKAGDFIQPDTGYNYPYTVAVDVPYSASANLVVQVHRPVIAQSGYSFFGKGLNVGVDCTFEVRMFTKPSYTVLPYDRVAFNSPFQLIEVIT